MGLTDLATPWKAVSSQHSQEPTPPCPHLHCPPLHSQGHTISIFIYFFIFFTYISNVVHLPFLDNKSQPQKSCRWYCLISCSLSLHSIVLSKTCLSRIFVEPCKHSLQCEIHENTSRSLTGFRLGLLDKYLLDPFFLSQGALKNCFWVGQCFSLPFFTPLFFLDLKSHWLRAEQSVSSCFLPTNINNESPLSSVLWGQDFLLNTEWYVPVRNALRV